MAAVARYLCCIVTATNVFVTRPIAAEFGIEHLLGIERDTDDGAPGGRFTGLSHVAGTRGWPVMKLF